MSKLPKMQFPLSKKQYQAIGEVAVQWAFLENSIDIRILLLNTTINGKPEFGMTNRGLAIGFEDRLKILKKLIKDAFSSELSDYFLAILPRVKLLHSQRNKILKGLWGNGDYKEELINLSTPRFSLKTIKNLLNSRKIDIFKFEDLQNIADEIGYVNHLFNNMEISEKVINELINYRLEATAQRSNKKF